VHRVADRAPAPPLSAAPRRGAPRLRRVERAPQPSADARVAPSERGEGDGVLPPGARVPDAA
jgi:hypothetical protein